jgi:MFS family permease
MNSEQNNQTEDEGTPITGSGTLGLVAHTFRALGQRNYLLYFIGQLISLVGTWMQFIALPWLVLSFYPGVTSVLRFTFHWNYHYIWPHIPSDLSVSLSAPLLLGVVGFSGQIPGFLLSPFGGLVADRFNRRRILLVTQSLSMVQAFVLAGLVLSGHLRAMPAIYGILDVLALSAFGGIINAFDMPTRQAFVVEMTQDKEVLGNAIALNSSMFNGARLFGPAIAGLLIAKFGTGWCFFINGASFIAVLACILAMRIPYRHIQRSGVSFLSNVMDGVRYSVGSPPIKYTIALLFFISLVGMPYGVLLPVIVKTILHGGPRTLGFLVGASGIGALIGALFLAARRSVLGLGKWIPVATTMFGLSLVAFAFSRNMWLSCGILAITGFGMIVQMAASNTIIQTVVDEDKRGRVMSLYTMSFLGAAPFGSLLAGIAANKIGPPLTVAIGGMMCVVAAALFSTKLPGIREHTRPVYIRMGIIPEAPDVQAIPAFDASIDPQD